MYILNEGECQHAPTEPTFPAPSAAGEGMSDSDKIGLQLHLDVQELGNQLANTFGLFPSEMPSYQKLMDAVNPQKAAKQ